MGSLYGPNEEAARFIVDTLAPALPGVTFAICGGVGAAFHASVVPRISDVTLQLVEAHKAAGYLEATDVAINPMFSGSGTNIKMFDFMAAGLPIVTTAIGARGIRRVPTVRISRRRAMTSRANFDRARRSRAGIADGRRGPACRELFVGAALAGLGRLLPTSKG